MTFTCIDCHDATCARHGSSDAACDEFTMEDVADEPAQVQTPQQILSCDCHAGFDTRLCVLEDLVSRMRREMTRGVELLPDAARTVPTPLSGLSHGRLHATASRTRSRPTQNASA